MRIVLIAAMDRNGILGKEGALPFRLPSDLRRFREYTWGKSLLSGFATWESLPGPLPGRSHLVLSRRHHEDVPGCRFFLGLEEAMNWTRENRLEELVVIGGASVYAQLLPHADELRLTHVEAEVEGDARFPEFSGLPLREEIVIPRLQEPGDEFAYSLKRWHRISGA